MFLEKEFAREYSFSKCFSQHGRKKKSFMGEGHGLKGTIIR
jgi:hypothetical protein